MKAESEYSKGLHQIKIMILCIGMPLDLNTMPKINGYAKDHFKEKF